MESRALIYKNEESEPVWLQIDPWADLLFLLPGEEVNLYAEVESAEDEGFEIGDRDGDLQIIYTPNWDDYFFIEGTEKINRSDYGSNVIGWSAPLCSQSSLKGTAELKKSEKT